MSFPSNIHLILFTVLFWFCLGISLFILTNLVMLFITYFQV